MLESNFLYLFKSSLNPMRTFLATSASPTPTPVIQPQEQPNNAFTFLRNQLGLYGLSEIGLSFIILLILGTVITLLWLRVKPNLADNIKKTISNLLASEMVPSITYSEAIRYFVEQRQKHPGLFTKGAMLLEQTTEGYIFIQVFLDQKTDLVVQENGRPYGRRLLVNQLDNELLKTFDQKPLVIVE
jgi:hypothetical protein